MLRQDFLSLFQSVLHDKGHVYDSCGPKYKTKISKRTCKKCNLYFGSGSLLSAHKRICKKLKSSKKKNQRHQEFQDSSEDEKEFEIGQVDENDETNMEDIDVQDDVDLYCV